MSVVAVGGGGGRLSPNRPVFRLSSFSLGSKIHQIRLQNQLIVRKSAAKLEYIGKSAKRIVGILPFMIIG